MYFITAHGPIQLVSDHLITSSSAVENDSHMCSWKHHFWVFAVPGCVSKTRGRSESVSGGCPFVSSASGAVVGLLGPTRTPISPTGARNSRHVRRSWCLRCDRLCHGQPLRNSAEYHFRSTSGEQESAPPRASSGASRKFSVARDKTVVSAVPPREWRSSPIHEQRADDDLVQATFRRRTVKTHQTDRSDRNTASYPRRIRHASRTRLQT